MEAILQGKKRNCARTPKDKMTIKFFFFEIQKSTLNILLSITLAIE